MPRIVLDSSVLISAFIKPRGLVAEMVANLPELHAVPNDPQDNPIVAMAVAARADDLVSGDRKHLLSLGSYENIQVVSPRAFLELI
ncbi:MAG: hypothetical protein KF778_21625 [Rhodocyclaceae bacterium]|uniref:PIN domain-containing protein n=1 Tax=metagenome TaxID=256318 RepID=A0A380THV6_9ZZZZ|nr:hypothetical protein [Rhodocyclaceae bacterium]SUS07758.1 hypothetical protein DF3PB_50028 [uncultured Defluviicoccus sp.]